MAGWESATPVQVGLGSFGLNGKQLDLATSGRVSLHEWGVGGGRERDEEEEAEKKQDKVEGTSVRR